MTREEMELQAKLNAKAIRRSQSVGAVMFLFVWIPLIIIGITVVYLLFFG